LLGGAMVERFERMEQIGGSGRLAFFTLLLVGRVESRHNILSF